MRFRARSSSRESVGEGRSRYIKRISTLSDRGIFAIIVGSNSSSKVFFRVGRYTKEKRKSVASKSTNDAKSTRGDVRLPGVSDFRVDDVILKTNFPLTAMRLPFLRSLRTYSSSLNSVFSFRKRAFLEAVLSRADPDRSIYCFIGVSRVEERMIELTSDVASYSSIPIGSELSSREQSRSFGVVIGGRVT
jgi:hypothetical protein